jgi:hypothetical protein
LNVILLSVVLLNVVAPIQAVLANVLVGFVCLSAATSSAVFGGDKKGFLTNEKFFPKFESSPQ